jgi:hypothetical protein
MRQRAFWLLLVLVVAGCSARPPAKGEVYTGEVWNWDTQTDVVTLRQANNTFVRVRIPREDLRVLRRGEIATVRGTLEPPVDIDHSFVATTATTRPRGAAESLEVSGTVTALDPGGKVTIETGTGPVEVWTTADGPPLKLGDVARVLIRIQPLELVPFKPREVPPPSVPPVPPTGSEPGHYAAVRGRITQVQLGRITVESPRGPITVAVPRSESYGVDGWVDGQTSLHAGR